MVYPFSLLGCCQYLASYCEESIFTRCWRGLNLLHQHRFVFCFVFWPHVGCFSEQLPNVSLTVSFRPLVYLINGHLFNGFVRAIQQKLVCTIKWEVNMQTLFLCTLRGYIISQPQCTVTQSKNCSIIVNGLMLPSTSNQAQDWPRPVFPFTVI